MNCHRSKSGVALVITLIMLSVITIIAVAFLLLSQRERTSVSSTMSATEAELMVNAGFSRAKADVLAQMASFIATNIIYTNAANVWFSRRAMGPDLSVSLYVDGITNYPGPADFTFLTNLLFDPSAPVFVGSNGTFRGVFYHDLNRNGKFDETGFVRVRDSSGGLTGQTNYVVGDPQWIGMLARINQPHSASNRFVGRFAFLIIPAGRTEDVDFIHNRGKWRVSDFFRSQGHGSWEINLAAFLADLNNVQWGPNYRYDPSVNSINNGVAFLHANQILGYRYGGQPLRSALDVFGAAANAFALDGIDEYADGDNGGADNDPTLTAWPGSPNPQHFFTIHDFFNPKLQMAGFQRSLRNAGFSNDTYNAYTFYRMLAQLGTDSAPEYPTYYYVSNNAPVNLSYDGRNSARINLNYMNTNGLTAGTFTEWDAATFFQVTADRLLREYGFTDGGRFLSVTNLTVYRRVGSGWTNFYTADVHRILQMTLNIYDATTTNRGARGAQEYPCYPTVLKPQFQNIGGEVSIVGYREMGPGERGITNATLWLDRSEAAQVADLKDRFIYGVPVLIGAKKGYPSFNEFVSQSDVQFERVLNVWKAKDTSLPSGISQRFLVGVSNNFGLELWNSYTSTYPRGLRMVFAGIELTNTLTVTNLDTRSSTIANTRSFRTSFETNYAANNWGGREFRIPGPNFLWTNAIMSTNQIYSHQNNQFYAEATKLSEAVFPQVQWILTTENRFRFFIFDASDRLVDAVSLSSQVTTNLSQALSKAPNDFDKLWGTAPASVPSQVAPGLAGTRLSMGIVNQIEVGAGDIPSLRLPWDNYGYWGNVKDEKSGFRTFLRVPSNSPVAITNQAPFTPQVKVCNRLLWQANDPLVHYMDEDLRRPEGPRFSGAHTNYALDRLKFNILKENEAYKPWRPDGVDVSDPSKGKLYANLHLTDPNIHTSDNWEFPTNKFPSVGWLGRVHRGTPWQTISFKPWFPTQDWGAVHYSMRAHPTNDWRLADIFTVAQHPNASRGRLSVNQTNVAGWSAVLAGIPVTTFAPGTPAGKTNYIVEPVVNEPYVERLVEAINLRRETLRGKVFHNLAEFLSVPELTTASPYLTPPYAPSPPTSEDTPLRDEDYERIPEAILSLVKPGEARFVIYAFGQSLRPAPQSVLPGGNYRGLCLNYEVTGETAVRAVVRVELDYQANGPPRPRAVVESYNILPPD